MLPKENLSYGDLPPVNERVWKEIWERNLRLSPEKLGEFFPAYNQFQQIPDQPPLKSKTGAVEPQETKPFFIGWLGPTCSGKTNILEYIKKNSLFPFIRIITTTTRTPRIGEKGIYYFETTDKFKQGIKDGIFVEYKPRKNDLYGTTYQEAYNDLDKARQKQICTVIWGGDIDGLERFESNILNKFQIPVPSVFLFPEMSIKDYSDHVKRNRPDDWEPRLSIAEWEFEHAPERVDYFITNPFPNGFRDTVNATVTLFRRLCGEPI